MDSSYQYRVQLGLNQLPLGQARALRLIGSYGFPIEEVGREMQISPQEAAKLFMDGLEHLREIVHGPLPDHSAIAHVPDAVENPSRPQSSADTSVYEFREHL